MALFDQSEMRLRVRTDEADSDARTAGTPGAADAMHVIIRGARQIVVHDRGQMLDIDAASSDIRGDQDLQFVRLELRERLRACALTELAVKRCSFDTRTSQLLGDVFRRVLRRDEHQHPRPPMIPNESQEQLRTTWHIHSNRALVNIRRRL